MSQTFKPLSIEQQERLSWEYAAAMDEIEELRELVHDAIGPTVAWASTWQNRNGTTDLHPQHQALIDRMTTAVNRSTSK